ncbi:MAG: 7-cyano-7-deazaguanine synthase [Candidatus Binataceae bacterium]|nr:7-cyano-7-deazaguanine synthase [Candidatus Binataceae bacterium]
MKRSQKQVAQASANVPDGYRITPVAGRITVLASGGLDSSVMLGVIARSGRHVFPVYIRAGLSWERDELATLRRFVRVLKLPNIERVTALTLPMRDLAGDHWSMTGRKVPGYNAALASNYILGRNFTLLTKAAIFSARNQIGEIAMAPLESNPFPDARPEFFRAFARAVELGVGIKLVIRTPFAGKSKADVVRAGAGMPMELTVSCARPAGIVHCGACTKCAERVEGFLEAGVPDPTHYARKPARPKLNH